MVTRELADRLLETYGTAWMNQDSDLILTIFHPDATYQEKAFGKPLIGHEEIRRYWDTKVCEEQSDIKFKVLKSWISGNTILAEWEAHFNSTIKGKVDLLEVAIMEIKGDKIKSLREYYDARTEVLENYLKSLGANFQ